MCNVSAAQSENSLSSLEMVNKGEIISHSPQLASWLVFSLEANQTANCYSQEEKNECYRCGLLLNSYSPGVLFTPEVK